MIEKREPVGNATGGIIVRQAAPAAALVVRAICGNGAGGRRGSSSLSLRCDAGVVRWSKNSRLRAAAGDTRGPRDWSLDADAGNGREQGDLDICADGTRARQRSSVFHLRQGCDRRRKIRGSRRAPVGVGPTDQMAVHRDRYDITHPSPGRLTRSKIPERSVRPVKMLMAMATAVEAGSVAALRMGNGRDVDRQLFDPRGPTDMQRELSVHSTTLTSALASLVPCRVLSSSRAKKGGGSATGVPLRSGERAIRCRRTAAARIPRCWRSSASPGGTSPFRGNCCR